jgi:ATP-dependent Clp protease adaptor protein ClpS
MESPRRRSWSYRAGLERHFGSAWKGNSANFALLVFWEVSFRPSWINKRCKEAQGTRRRKGSQEMSATENKRAEGTQTRRKAKPDLPWNVILYNDWEHSMPQVVVILKKVIPGMTLKRATKIMWEAHSTGKALVKSCHRELAELYEERLLAKGLTVSIEPSG